MTTVKIKTATGVIRWYMQKQGFKGWTSFWNTIYMLPGYENHERLLRHEFKHIEQIKRDGRLVFAVKYLWWSWRVGYRNNPYEVEARAAEN